MYNNSGKLSLKQQVKSLEFKTEPNQTTIPVIIWFDLRYSVNRGLIGMVLWRIHCCYHFQLSGYSLIYILA